MPQHLFQKQLKGETPLSLATAKRLASLAERLLAYRPWRHLGEADLVFLRRSADDLRVLSVMGALGEVFIVIAYQGLEGYRFFDKMHTADTFQIGDFYGEQRSVYVEYEKRAELTPPDRELLKAVDYSETRGARLPRFRAVRPGYHPWYLTEPEGVVLADSLDAMLFVCEKLEEGVPTWWDRERIFPLLTPAGGDAEAPFQVEQFAPPHAPEAAPAAIAVDAQRLQRVLAHKRMHAGVLQVDHFFVGARIGGANERKALPRLALAVDGKSGFVFPPELSKPEADAGALLAEAIWKVLEAGAPPPREIHVRSAEYKCMLEPLAGALGARLLVRKAMPALDQARDGLLRMMGDPPVE